MENPQSPPTVANPRKQVFVAYSYRLYPKDDYRKLYKALEEKHDVTFIFADEKITNMHIMKKIESYIRGSDFSLFDISGWNPNVTLELGFAMAISEKWYIAIDPSKTTTEEVPSDLRGLDRIQYGSYSELETKLTILIEQNYPKKKQSGISDFFGERQAQVVELLKKSPGLTCRALSQLLQLEVPVVQLILQPLIGNQLEAKGNTRGKRYYLSGSEKK